MTSRTVIATFDAGKPEDGTSRSKVYKAVREKLEYEYLRVYLIDKDHIQNPLPNNTFSGQIPAESAMALLEIIFGAVDDAFLDCRVEGRCFVYVGGPDEAKDVRKVG